MADLHVLQEVPTEVMPGAEGSQFNPASQVVPGNKSMLSSGIEIRSPMQFANPGSVMYINASKVPAQSTKFQFSESTGVLTVSGMKVAEGTNARMGTATLVAGTKVVTTSAVTANSRIFLTIQSLGTVAVPKAIGVTARTAGTSFTITSADGTDTSVIAWEIKEPA